jgi:TPR repeat protein
MYLNGVGVEKSRKNAKTWFKKSCALGYNDSCEEIKKMNAFGNAILETVNESIQNYNSK